MTKPTVQGRERWLLIIVAVLGVITAVWHGAARPFVSHIRDVHRERQREERRLRKDRALLRDAAEVQKAGQPLREMYQLPGGEDRAVSEVTRQVEQAARDKAININALRPRVEGRIREERQIVLDVQLEADDERLWAWMHQLQSPPLLLRVREMQMRPLVRQEDRLQGRLVIERLYIDGGAL